MSNPEQQHRLIRGLFTGPELEKCLWETSWITYAASERSEQQHLQHRFTQGLPPGLSLVANRLQLLLNAHFHHVRLDRHTTGDQTQRFQEELLPVTCLCLLSLDKFRGGRTEFGDFMGYINPGEVLQITTGPEVSKLMHRVDKITSGQRLLLVLQGSPKTPTK